MSARDRRYGITAVLAAVTVLVAATAAAAKWKYMAVSRIDWQPYGSAAYQEAARRSVPLFVFVYADWCRWCKKLEQETLETPRIRKWLAESYLPVAVDYDKQPKLAAKLGARLVPTVLLVSPKGEKLLRFFGFLKAADLEGTLKDTLAAWRAGELPEETMREFGSFETCCPLVPPPE